MNKMTDHLPNVHQTLYFYNKSHHNKPWLVSLPSHVNNVQFQLLYTTKAKQRKR